MKDATRRKTDAIVEFIADTVLGIVRKKEGPELVVHSLGRRRSIIAPAGVCTTGASVVVFAVGAVYDRATFASEWAKCAVIDRAYNLSHRQSHV